jgi:hypothetical protein
MLMGHPWQRNVINVAKQIHGILIDL